MEETLTDWYRRFNAEHGHRIEDARRARAREREKNRFREEANAEKARVEQLQAEVEESPGCQS